MQLSLGFSTCPNDTFIFDAMVHQKIDTEGLTFDLTLGDVEELNKLAFSKDLAITKLSYHAYAHVFENYQLLESGSALGRNNGPLLISKNEYGLSDLESLRLAIPGKYTTASLLLQSLFPQAKNTTEMLFSDIENAVLSGEVDAGLIIHENRFTYKDRGLHKIVDLGAEWEAQTGNAIPLGGIVVDRSLPDEIKQTVQRVLKRSVEYAVNNPSESVSYMKQYAQEMAESIMKQHVDLYVNNFTVELGDEGRVAIKELYSRAFSNGIIPNLPKNIFLS